jgi:hypothetical protein
MAELWERQKYETNRAYEAFAAYRDMGVNRSLDAVSRKLNKSIALLGRWSTANNWVERATAYDDHIEALERAAMEKERIAQRKRRLKISLAFQSKLVRGLETLDLDGIKATDLANALKTINAEIRRDMLEDEPANVQINNSIEITPNSTREELMRKLEVLRDGE